MVWQCLAMEDELLDQRLQLVISRRQIAAVDEWRRGQPDLPSRSEAIRRLVQLGLAGGVAKGKAGRRNA